MRTYKRQHKSRQSRKRLHGGGLYDIIAKAQQVLASVQERLIGSNRLKAITGQALIETTQADLAKLIRVEEELQAAQARIKAMGATAAAATAAEVRRRNQIRKAAEEAALATAATQLATTKREIHNEVSSFNGDVDSIKTALEQREQYREMLQRLLTESMPRFEKMADSIYSKINDSDLLTKETILTQISAQQRLVSALKENMLKYIQSTEALLASMGERITELNQIKANVETASSTLNGLDNIAEVQSRGVSIRGLIESGRGKITEFRRIQMPVSIQTPGRTINEASMYIRTIDGDFNKALNTYLQQLERNAIQRVKTAAIAEAARRRQAEVDRLLAEQKAEEERQAALATERAQKAEEARQAALARAAAEQKRREEEEAVAAAAAAAAAKAAAAEAARLAAEQAVRDREAAKAAAEAAAAAELAAQLAETRRVLEGMVQQKHQKSLQLKEQHNIEKYESNIETREGAFLRNKALQFYLFMFLRELDRILYTSPAALRELSTGLSEEATTHFGAGPDEIKANLFRFFVKGGAAPVLLFNRRGADGIYQFTNDIDTIVLINPELSPKDYDQLHANLMRVIVNVIDNIITYGASKSFEDTNVAIRAHYKKQPLMGARSIPRVFKYKITNEKQSAVPEKEEERLGEELNKLADEYSSTFIFDIHRQLSKLSALPSIVSVTNTIKDIQQKISILSTEIATLNTQASSSVVQSSVLQAQASQLDMDIRPLQQIHKTLEHIIGNQATPHSLREQSIAQLSAFNLQMDGMTQQWRTIQDRLKQLQESINEIYRNIAEKTQTISEHQITLQTETAKLSLIDTKADLEAQLKQRLLTCQIFFNYGYGEIVENTNAEPAPASAPANGAAAPAPAPANGAAAPAPAPANAAPAPAKRTKKRTIFLNESIIQITPNREPDYVNDTPVPIDLLDIVIPLQSNKFLRDDWRYWSVKRIYPLEGAAIAAGAVIAGFDVSDPVYSLFDQNRATRGSAGLPHLAAKYKSRKARRAYLQAQVLRLARNDASKIKELLNTKYSNIRNQIMERLEGGRRSYNRQTLKRGRRRHQKNLSRRRSTRRQQA